MPTWLHMLAVCSNELFSCCSITSMAATASHLTQARTKEAVAGVENATAFMNLHQFCKYLGLVQLHCCEIAAHALMQYGQNLPNCLLGNDWTPQEEPQ